MAIPGQRFKILTNETNVATMKLAGISGSDPVNIGNNAAEVVSEGVKAIVASSSQVAKSLLKQSGPIGDILSKYSRQVKGMIGSAIDYAGLPKGVFDTFAEAIAPENPRLSKTLHEVMVKCGGRGAGFGYGGKPYDIRMDCRGNSAKMGRLGSQKNCNANNFNSALGAITGKKPFGPMKDRTSGLNALTSLSGYGYGMGMCGVFGELKNSSVFSEMGLGNLEYAKAAGGLLGMLGNSGNVKGWIDVAASSVGLSPLLVNPSSINDLFINYTIPDNSTQRDWLSLADMTLDAVDSVDSNWYSSEMGGVSISELGSGTHGLDDVFETKLTNRAFGKDELDVIPSDPMDFMLSSGISV